MSHALRRAWGHAALTLLLGTLSATTPTHAGPLLLSPLLSVPQTYDAAFASPSLSALPPTTFSTSAMTPSVGRLPVTENVPALPSSLPLASPWLMLRLSDPTLNFTSWRQVLNVARLGVFVVPLRDDPGERTNIILAAQAVDDTTVAPGAVFSFNETVGERTPERGYQDGLMFSEGQLIRGTGGGICIIATGLYNAALHAGLTLLERHPHSSIVGYAPPGCDASIVYGSEDMRFQNTTGSPITVKTQVKDDCVVVALYGQTPPPGYHVIVRNAALTYIHAPTIEQPDPTLPPTALPVVAQKPRLGFDVTIERVWTEGAHILRRETVVSEHRAPRPKIVRVPIPPPAPTLPVLPYTWGTREDTRPVSDLVPVPPDLAPEGTPSFAKADGQ